MDKDAALLLRLRTILLGSGMAPPAREEVDRLGDIANRIEGMLGYISLLEKQNEWLKNKPRDPFYCP